MNTDAETIRLIVTNFLPVIFFKYMLIPLFLVGLITKSFRKV